MILIKNANLVSMANINYEITDILIDAGKILEIGIIDINNYPQAEIIDAKGAFVTPGLVESHCHVGLEEDVVAWAGSDGNEMSNPITPEMRGIDAVKPHDPCFAEAIEGGVTTVVTGPGSANVIGGTFVALKTYGKTIFDMLLKEEVAMKMALGENPKYCYGKKDIAPVTRMANASLMRDALYKAQDYYERKKACSEGQEGAIAPEFNLQWESLSRVFDGFLVKIHCHQADDITTAIRIIEEFGLNATIEHCTDGYLIADTLVAHNQACIIGPVWGTKSKIELKNMSFSSGKILKDAGVLFAIMTDHPFVPLNNALMQGAFFVKAGMTELDVLKALTINAAKLTGIDDRVGSIEKGKDADIVIWSGNPFDYMTSPTRVLINGKVVL